MDNYDPIGYLLDKAQQAGDILIGFKNAAQSNVPPPPAANNQASYTPASGPGVITATTIVYALLGIGAIVLVVKLVK